MATILGPRSGVSYTRVLGRSFLERKNGHAPPAFLSASGSRSVHHPTLTKPPRHDGRSYAFKLPQTLTSPHLHDEHSSHIRRHQSSGTASRLPQEQKDLVNETALGLSAPQRFAR